MTSVFAASLLVTTLAFGTDDPVTSKVLTQENTAPVQAASGHSDADRVRERVKEGQKVRITDDQGSEWRGRIDTLTPDNLTVVTHDRQRKDLPYGTILRIDRPHDSLANGALIGLATGAAFGLALVAALDQPCDQPDFSFLVCGDATAGAYVVGPLLFGGLGAAAGVGIDSLIKRNPTLYQRTGATRVRLAPAVGPGFRGVVVSARW